MNPTSSKTGPSGPVSLFHRTPPACRTVGVVVSLALAGLATSGRAAEPARVIMPASRPGYRATELRVPADGTAGFTLMSPAAIGLNFTNHLAESRSLTNHILLNGSGVALGDVDGDGRPDLYLGALDGPNALFRNDGNWRFHEITTPALAAINRDTSGVALADLDGDGDLDLLVNALGRGTACFFNDGLGRFAETTGVAGTGSLAGSMSLALADIDGDGDLDVYVANYRTSTIRDRFGVRLRINRVEGRLVVTAFDGRPTTEPDLLGRFSVDAAGNLMENGEADTLFINKGGGRFRAQNLAAGRFLDQDGVPMGEPWYDWSLTAMFRDMDGDGWPDLYVCSDMASEDRIWINQRDGRFRALRREALRKTSWFSMGVDFADLNRDGLDDFLVTDMVSREHRLRQVQISNHKFVHAQPGRFDDRPQAARNTLFLNLGDGDFAEIAQAAGLEASEWSWAPTFLDVDLDGYEDVLIATGFERDVQDIDVADELEAARQSRKLSDVEALALRRKFPALRQANLLFRNRGDLTFEEVGARWGFAEIGISQGMALADLDGDGDLDVAVNNLNGPAGLYRNNSPAPRVAVRLRGQAPNTRGIGARVILRGGAVPQQSQELICGGRYLSSDDPMRVFAAGTLTNQMQLEIRWRSGPISTVEGVLANHLYEIDEPETTRASPSPPRSPPSPPPLFEDLSSRLLHSHRESGHDDFARQPLLPRKLSQAGPGVAWHDFDEDGWQDLILGAARGGSLALFRNDTRGGFIRLTNALTQPVSRDLTGLVVWQGGGPSRLLAGMSNHGGAEDEPASVMQLDFATGTVTDAVPPDASEPGPLALADIDGDGDLDLFVGGRFRPGRYPEAADSRLFRRQPEGWVPDEPSRAVFQGLGLVNGAVFTDLDADGYPELAVACDWGPPRIFHNDGAGRFQEATAKLGLADFRGWWQGIAAGDLDGDGRMDLLVSNWGTNTRYRPQAQRPLHLFYGDFNGGGRVDLLEAYTDGPAGRVVPWHHFGRVRRALPFVQERFGTYRAFADATIPEILGDRRASARELTATWLETTLFLNRGNRLVARPLPFAAQLAPAFAMCVADVDGDGREDVFLGQNFFATDPETDRHDGGRGLWLRGDGAGGLDPLSALESGVRVYGEQRGAAVGDFDRDGRTDLVVSQNGNQTRLFHNVRGEPGLLIRLRGTLENPRGIGAVVRLDFGDSLGPAREVHAGSGYFSQNSAEIVLGTPRPPRAVMVRWPGGGTTRTEVPRDAREIEAAWERPPPK